MAEGVSASPAFFWLPSAPSAGACTLVFRLLLVVGPRAGSPEGALWEGGRGLPGDTEQHGARCTLITNHLSRAGNAVSPSACTSRSGRPRRASRAHMKENTEFRFPVNSCLSKAGSRSHRQGQRCCRLPPPLSGGPTSVPLPPPTRRVGASSL